MSHHKELPEKLVPQVTEWKDGQPWTQRNLSPGEEKANEIIDFLASIHEEKEGVTKLRRNQFAQSLKEEEMCGKVDSEGYMCLLPKPCEDHDTPTVENDDWNEDMERDLSFKDSPQPEEWSERFEELWLINFNKGAVESFIKNEIRKAEEKERKGVLAEKWEVANHAYNQAITDAVEALPTKVISSKEVINMASYSDGAQDALVQVKRNLEALKK